MWSVFENMFGQKPAIKEVHVHFEKKKLRVTFSPEDYDSQKQVPLNTFRSKLAHALQVPPRELTLFQLNPQRKLSNLKATLEDYGLKDGNDVLAVHVKAEAPKAAPPAPKPQLTTNERIDQIVSSVETELGGRIDKLISEGPPADPEQRETENRVLNEIVLARTIALDDVEVATPEERQHRKTAIARMQKYHKDIDVAMAKAPKQDAPQPPVPVAQAEEVPQQDAVSASAEQQQQPQQQQQQQQPQQLQQQDTSEASTRPSSSPATSNANSGKSRKKKSQNKKKGKR